MVVACEGISGSSTTQQLPSATEYALQVSPLGDLYAVTVKYQGGQYLLLRGGDRISIGYQASPSDQGTACGQMSIFPLLKGGNPWGELYIKTCGPATVVLTHVYGTNGFPDDNPHVFISTASKFQLKFTSEGGDQFSGTITNESLDNGYTIAHR